MNHPFNYSISTSSCGKINLRSSIAYFDGTVPVLKQEISTVSHAKRSQHLISMTKHSQIRAAQRGLDYHFLLLAIEFGESFRKQGMVFYGVAENQLPDEMDHKLKAKLNNLVVVTNVCGDKIITAYKAKNSIKHIKRKSNTLW